MKYSFFLFVFLLISFNRIGFSASHYIRSGASGSNSGASWSDAWPSFASTVWTRGDTYYLAGGTYSESPVITKAQSGTTWIYIRKANATENSGNAGWSSSYASSQAIINGQVAILDGYFSIDGVTGSGTNGHGIRVYNGAGSHVLDTEGSVGPYKLAHIDFEGLGFGSSSNAFDGVYLLNGAGSMKGTSVTNCWIHGVTRNGVTIGGNVGTSFSDYGFLFENNVVSEIGGCLNPDAHGQGMQISFSLPDQFLIIRGNTYRNIEGTAMIAYLGGAGASHRDSLIYNNLFLRTDTNYNIMSPGIIYSHDTASACSNIVVANNTVWGIGSTNAADYETLAQFALDTPSATNNILINNVWEFSRFSTTNRGFNVISNNAYFASGVVPSGTPGQVTGTTTTFNSAATGDFSLVAGGYAVGAGADMSGAFTTDILGNTRTVPWDIGAYKYTRSTRILTIGSARAGNFRRP